MKLVREINLEYVTVGLYDPELVKIEIKGNTIIGALEAKGMTDQIGVLSGGKEVRVMIVADELAQFDKGAREYSASDAGFKYTIADALVVKNLAQRLIANFYLKINKPKKPSRIFNSEEEAVKWLFSIKENAITG